MTVSTGAIAAIAMRSERELVTRLRHQGAVDADHAVAVQSERMIDRSVLRRLTRAEAVRSLDDGRLWLDEAAYVEMRERRKGRIFLSLFGLAAVLIIAAGAVARFG